MSEHSSKQGVLFKGLGKKAVVARFDQAYASSDGGAVLLKACDERLGLSRALVGCYRDGRQAGKVRHAIEELFGQRFYGIACGYADGNDAARLADDPVMKLLNGRAGMEGDALASQPTLSRFENAVGRADLLRMSTALADTVIRRHRRRRRQAKRITIDLDPTQDPTHGGQQLSLFNGFYDRWCYLPLAGFMSFGDEPEQYLFCYVLRPGQAAAKEGCVGVLKRVVPRLRKAFPKARIRIRLDSGFAGPELYEYFESEGLDYIVGMAKNEVLLRLAEPAMEVVRADAEGDIETVCYDEALYAARSWSRERRVLIKGQITHHPGRTAKDNPRFVVTNLQGSPQRLYEQVYCARGDVENRIKELKDGLEIDRTSCTSFLANQLRALITAAAYVLFQELRLHARHTRFARTQVTSLRLLLVKLGAWIESSVRRIVLHLPSTALHAEQWRRIAQSLGAVPT